MRIFLYILGGLAGIVVLFFVWAIWSVARGCRRRDEKLFTQLDPIQKRLMNKSEVLPDEVYEVARKPEVRHMLFAMLKEQGRNDLFPKEHLNARSEAEASLAYWMMHPNELQAWPAEMLLVDSLTHDIGGRTGHFFVFKYRMAEGHWAAKDGWLLGIAGPIFEGDDHYAKLAGAFSRVSDREDTITSSELLDWYVGMLRQKGMLPP
jgi:hypothetical protein